MSARNRMSQLRPSYRAAVISRIEPGRRRRSGFKWAAIILLGYIVKDDDIICPECLFSFSLERAFYVLEEHFRFKSDCSIAVKGGLTLNPIDAMMAADLLGISSSRLQVNEGEVRHSLQFNVAQLENPENILEILQTISDDLENIKIARPIATKSQLQIHSQILQPSDEIVVELIDPIAREESFPEGFNDSVCKILSCLGFYCVSTEKALLQCYFCRFKAVFTSLRILFASHNSFSRFCNICDYASLDYTLDHYRSIAINLYTGLKTYGSLWKLGEKLAVSSAICGFSFNSRNNCIYCSRCKFSVVIDELTQFNSYLDLVKLHFSEKSTCQRAKEEHQLHLPRVSERENFAEIRRIVTDLISNAQISLLSDAPYEGTGQNYGDRKTHRHLHRFLNQNESRRISFSDTQSVFPTLTSSEELLGIDPSQYFGAMTEKYRSTTSRLFLTPDDQLDVTCSVCLEQPVECLFPNCGHACTCRTCVLKIPSCPMCRSRVCGVLPIKCK